MVLLTSFAPGGHQLKQPFFNRCLRSLFLTDDEAILSREDHSTIHFSFTVAKPRDIFLSE